MTCCWSWFSCSCSCSCLGSSQVVDLQPNASNQVAASAANAANAAVRAQQYQQNAGGHRRLSVAVETAPQPMSAAVQGAGERWAASRGFAPQMRTRTITQMGAGEKGIPKSASAPAALTIPTPISYQQTAPMSQSIIMVELDLSGGQTARISGRQAAATPSSSANAQQATASEQDVALSLSALPASETLSNEDSNRDSKPGQSRSLLDSITSQFSQNNPGVDPSFLARMTDLGDARVLNTISSVPTAAPSILSQINSGKNA